MEKPLVNVSISGSKPVNSLTACLNVIFVNDE